MSTVIQLLNATAPAGAETFYRDTLVNKGTLLCLDFSNGGSFSEGNISDNAIVYDLAREASSELGIENVSYVNSSELTMTEGKGLTNSTLTVTGTGVRVTGNLNKYLFDNQPQTLLIFWVRKQAGATGSVTAIATLDNGSVSYPEGNITINVSQASVTGRIANTSIGAGVIPVAAGDLAQVAIEYNGEGNPMRIFLNGELRSTNIDGVSFLDMDGFQLLLPTQASSTPSEALYRLIIEDLDESGRTSEEVIQKDWDYCHGTGQYSGLPTKRPFIDTY